MSDVVPQQPQEQPEPAPVEAATPQQADPALFAGTPVAATPETQPDGEELVAVQYNGTDTPLEGYGPEWWPGKHRWLPRLEAAQYREPDFSVVTALGTRNSATWKRDPGKP